MHKKYIDLSLICQEEMHDRADWACSSKLMILLRSFLFFEEVLV
jgi:hypothetical protein